jgi:hypothetical protein
VVDNFNFENFMEVGRKYCHGSRIRIYLSEVKLIDFLHEQSANPEAASDAAVGFDPLSEDNGLQEAQVLDIRFEVAAGVAWLLLDCRGALHIDEGNTAVLAAQSIRHLEWLGPGPSGWYAHTILGSRSKVDNRTWSLEMELNPRSRLLLLAEHGQLFVGDVPGCDDASPDYTEDDDATIRAGMADWQSSFTPVYSLPVGQKR